MDKHELYLRCQAPFAAFRPFQSGSYRSTTLVPSPSAAYGLLLNLAAIEQRDEIAAPVTKIRSGLPTIDLAIGLPHRDDRPHRRGKANYEFALLNQQLHHYPVGASGKELAKKTYGSKYWIAPVTREVAIDLDVLIGVRADPTLLNRIAQGLDGTLDVPRYGLPFAGDNNFLFDAIEPLQTPGLARWYEPFGAEMGSRPGIGRFTVWIDRSDNSKTEIALMAPSTDFTAFPSDMAWLTLPR